MSLRAVVVEDEVVARHYLADILDGLSGIDLVGTASDGERGLALIAAESPDLAFLDVEMPGLSGLDVLREAKPSPWAIFTTAFDQHAVTAFELNAIDYILKPFGPERLVLAVDRARARLQAATRDSGGQLERVESALGGRRAVTRVFVESRGRIVPVLLAEVEHLRAQGDYVELSTSEGRYLVRVPFKRLLAQLDRDTFVQVHRSHAINLEQTAGFESLDDGRLQVRLKSGARVIASRARTPELRACLRLEHTGPRAD
ncbi:MAG: response regulator [Acidobacteria bacterium]|nr:response regulator [Acidobacteriota bacterium]